MQDLPRKKKKVKKVKKSSAPQQKLPSQEKEPGVVESEQSRHFLSLLQRTYKSAQDSALAAAQLDLSIAQTYAQDSGEVPDEFESQRFLSTVRKLLELKVIKDFAEALELGSYLPELMSARIHALFGAAQPTSKHQASTAFFGTDAEFLTHQVKQELSKQPPPSKG